MSNSKVRIRLLRLAELKGVIYPDTTVSAMPNLGTPPIFIASNKYPSLRKGFSNNAIAMIDKLSTVLNNALFYASNGEFYMDKLFQQNFNYSITDLPSSARDLRLLLLFVKNIFMQFYNNGVAYTQMLNKQQYEEKVNSLLKSPNLDSLSRLNPSSQLAVKLGVNLKTQIIEILNYMLTIAPTK